MARCPDPARAEEALVTFAELLGEDELWALARDVEPSPGEGPADSEISAETRGLSVSPLERLLKLVSFSRAAFRYLTADIEALRYVLTSGASLEEDCGEKALLDYLALHGVDPAAAEDGGKDVSRLRNILLAFKRMRWARIVAADLAGEESLEVCTLAMSSLADTCVRLAWRTFLKPHGIAVIAMGKLGGLELNYASDIDLLFVGRELATDPAAEQAARDFIRFLTGELESERIWLVDPDLRPEGKAGPLVRSISSYAKYWEAWAEPWEILALVKARPIADSEGLGQQFLALAQERLWPEKLDPEAIREIRRIKRRGEIHADATGRGFDIKRSAGGIRDLELAVQLLQLIHGRHDPELRVPTTLDAVHALERGGYIGNEDALTIADSYRFLRNVEHRLQVPQDRARYRLPEKVTEQRHIARSLGFSDTPSRTAEEAFHERFVRVTSDVREVHQKLFFRPLLERLAAVPASGASPALIEERLRALGFEDLRQAEASISELTAGLSRKSRMMLQLIPLALEWLSESPNPVAGLTRLRKLFSSVGESASLIPTFRDNPAALYRLCTILGTSKAVADTLTKHPEHVQALADDKALRTRKEAAHLVEEARTYTSWRDGLEEKIDGLLKFSRREFLRIATRDLLSYETREALAVGKELSGVTEGILRVASEEMLAAEGLGDVKFAVVGLGSFGAHEMSYSSDADVMFLYDSDVALSERSEADLQNRVSRAVAQLIERLSGLGSLGRGVAIDAELRPEGKAGPLARSLTSTLVYYRRWAQTWEFQALSKARYVAGDRSLCETFLESVRDSVWPEFVKPERIKEIRLMKARVERDRLPSGPKGRMHLKLGPGGLSDVQFLVELYCLKFGHENPELRSGSTLDRLAALVRSGKIDEDDAAKLEEAYTFCTAARNRLFLIKGLPRDSIPESIDEARVLAESMGYVGRPRGHLLEDYKKLTRRARAVFERLFYTD